MIRRSSCSGRQEQEVGLSTRQSRKDFSSAEAIRDRASAFFTAGSAADSKDEAVVLTPLVPRSMGFWSVKWADLFETSGYSRRKAATTLGPGRKAPLASTFPLENVTHIYFGLLCKRVDRSYTLHKKLLFR